MRTPAIQNDFSYYRRVLMREGCSGCSLAGQMEDCATNLNVANKVSLFYAEATPMLRTLSNVTLQFLNKVTIPATLLYIRRLHYSTLIFYRSTYTAQSFFWAE